MANHRRKSPKTKPPWWVTLILSLGLIGLVGLIAAIPYKLLTKKDVSPEAIEESKRIENSAAEQRQQDKSPVAKVPEELVDHSVDEVREDKAAEVAGTVESVDSDSIANPAVNTSAEKVEGTSVATNITLEDAGGPRGSDPISNGDGTDSVAPKVPDVADNGEETAKGGGVAPVTEVPSGKQPLGGENPAMDSKATNVNGSEGGKGNGKQKMTSSLPAGEMPSIPSKEISTDPMKEDDKNRNENEKIVGNQESAREIQDVEELTNFKEEVRDRINAASREAFSGQEKQIARDVVRKVDRLIKVGVVKWDGGSDLSEEQKSIIGFFMENKSVKNMLDDDEAMVIVLGFADPVGAELSNVALSKRRAESVLREIEQRTEGKRSYAFGIGETEMLDSANERNNRAAEIWVAVSSE